MEDKVTAVYLMVRQEELSPEDQGQYDRALARQEETIKNFLKEIPGMEPGEPVETYTLRRQLLQDMERDRLKRLVVLSLNRLGGTQEDIDALLHEFRQRQIEVLSVEPGPSRS